MNSWFLLEKLKPNKVSGPAGFWDLPDYTILDKWIFDNFILAVKLFAKTLRNLKTSVSPNNSFRWKLVASSESPVTFDERFKVTSVPCFIDDFSLLSSKLGNYIF